jgi:hypothetical protein
VLPLSLSLSNGAHHAVTPCGRVRDRRGRRRGGERIRTRGAWCAVALTAGRERFFAPRIPLFRFITLTRKHTHVPLTILSLSPPQPLQALRPKSFILMGKNTMMRKCIREFCERKGDDSWLVLAEKLVGNVGIIFTSGELDEVGLGTSRGAALYIRFGCSWTHSARKRPVFQLESARLQLETARVQLETARPQRETARLQRETAPGFTA